MVRTVSISALAASLYGCAYAASEWPEPLIPGQYWISPDRAQVLVVFPEQAETYYFNNNERRLCYTYRIEGRWRPGGKYARLESEDGRAIASVLLYSEQELVNFEGADLVERAAARITKVYEQNLGRPLAAKIVAFESPRRGAKRWSVSWRENIGGQSVQKVASKVLVEIAVGWVAMITVQGTPDDEGVTRRLLETLDTTSKPECYWPFIRQHIPEVR